jgi:catechol 2,3-dioxygenase-like lactoylglutathione lyase family enzyme
MADTNHTIDARTTTASAPVSRPSGSRSFNGVNHLKLATSDIWKCHDFYTKILPFTPLPQFHHYTPDHQLFAVMFEHTATNLVVEARYEPNQAKLQEGWDPVTWGVGTRKDLDDWAAWLDANQVKRSKILVGIKGWWLACEDPDKKHVRLYVEDEEHEWTDHPEKDPYWLRNLVADPKYT